LKNVLSKWQTELGNDGWNSLYWNNHDQPRIISRWGNDSKEYREKSGKMLATLLHMMKGTPYIYQGEEIGMTNIAFDNINDYKDIETLNLYSERTSLGFKEEDIMNSIKVKGRDNARTPMQWNESKNAGFTKGEPWIKINKNYKYINAKQAVENKDSIFYHYKKLIDLRKNNDVIIYGEYELILEDNKEIYSYMRKLNESKFLVINNFYENTPEFVMPEDINFENYELVISNYDDMPCDIRKFKLRPYESIVVSLK
jgi:oligo-1,6-glucosidase/glucan 1,6-alpha-glucosidase